MTVTPAQHALGMTDAEVEAAEAEGFELVERPCGDQWAWGFVRESDDRYPCFLEQRQAVSYMRDWLRQRTSVRVARRLTQRCRQCKHFDQ